MTLRLEMEATDVSEVVNRLYELMGRNDMIFPMRMKYSCAPTKQDKSFVQFPNIVKGMGMDCPEQALCSDFTFSHTGNSSFSL